MKVCCKCFAMVFLPRVKVEQIVYVTLEAYNLFCSLKYILYDARRVDTHIHTYTSTPVANSA